jgi:excisionase family DNA binding protein
MNLQELRSIAEVAKTLGISPHTLRVWIKDRRISSFKLGKRVLLSPDDVQAFLNRHHRVEAVTADNGGAAA